MDSLACLWGIKASFRRYLAMQPGAEATVGGGAAITARSEFLFPAAVGVDLLPPTGPGEMKFEGDVQFIAHGGLLNVILADPRIQRGDDQIFLSALTGQYSGSAGSPTVVAELVERIEADGSISYDATLASSGVQVFGGVYPAGEPLDAVQIVHNPLLIATPRAKKN
ncbi:HtaA domain-containing protein [Paenarthrobacter aromaticivorans]|uniref:HtaA domain-containing protein n=1 Tax=Paenarthrobacter aromaticivorans TaxID=2849150 RepID=A0ABS6I1M5_9MICC|nr:HtaA domain-containing protein [Paenarthrobacter sp. MMS21-TAE1-1]MBU8865636.1 HtaA domain-containing protein [Paenarthrobacter sp. MMS21-TAE1-1]